MCGLFGWVLSSANYQSRDTLVRLTDMMKHRGPDDAGYWLGGTADQEFQIGLGHRRLSIIDIGGGAQPMRSADDSIILIFNGEIYNYLELREELCRLGRSFRTNSDTEVLIESYLVWGLDAIRRFRGMFAFALWDSEAGRLVIARDAFGKKPLFLARGQGALLFASEIEPLVQSPGFDRSLDPEALDHYLLNRYVPAPSTFFRAAKKLPPGCYGVWQRGRLQVTRYFTPPLATVEPDIRTFDEAVSMFEHVFDESVRIRMRSDAPFGAYLSGGIDSSAVVASMVRHSGERVRTFSVGFHEPKYSELASARAVASRFGTDHQELIVEPKAFMEHWPTAVLRRGAPVSEASDIPILMLSQMAGRTVKMVLTGEGSDELLGGYPKHRAERWLGIYQRLVPKVVHDAIIAPSVRLLPYGSRRIKILAAAAGERDLANRMRIWFGGLSIERRDAILCRSGTVLPPDLFPFSAPIGSSMRRTLFFDQTSWLPDNLLERGDRMMMAGSIEGRMPFMDTTLAATVARFSDGLLIGGRGGKAVLRAAMAKILPLEILKRRKIGYRVPFNEWFRGPYRNFVADMLVSSDSKVSRMCNRELVRRLVTEHADGRQNHERVLWTLVNLELFLRTFRPSGIAQEALGAT